ncbi:DUF349 domain-containing protein [Pseudonocardia sp. WMMC193]|uniref:DUF349 domain-containing protein n=1 Tax=Pseudonocardia sp. WMMC193 TaxID=2911965 RepID=UPI001F1DF7A5|nr:DUF349 domain-containing protein [Pseudonocardia sp. WMMC193]MCF7549991.1 DUF349 domain-containing protein [Pseudonocardia sp. WMMC193]
MSDEQTGPEDGTTADGDPTPAPDAGTQVTAEQAPGPAGASTPDERQAPEQATDPAPPATQAEPVAPRPAAPRPGPPRPGPRPGPPPGGARPAAPAPSASPVPAAAPVEPSPVSAASEDPRRWGRVDAEGVVFLRTAEGEREIGSWQAGAPDEGLAHFARRFDDLLAETELLVTRLATGGGDPKHALTGAKALRDGLDTAAVLGDVEGLRKRLDELVGMASDAVEAAKDARDQHRQAAVARKEELAAEAEAMANESTQWKQAGDRYKAILDEWRAIKGIDRKTDEALWKRFSRAREAFNRRRGSHFADLDRQRGAAKARKEELVAEAEALSSSDDWGPTAARFRDLMTEWKAAGRAQKDTDDALWHRFRGAQDAFFQRRSSMFAERDEEFEANAAAKRALLAEAEKIDTADADAARAALRGIQERWEEIGKVPRDDIRPLEQRLRAVEDAVKQAAEREWRRTDPETEARVAQFRERVEQFEAQAEKARAAGNARKAKEAEDQAAQWREWLEAAQQSAENL